MLTSIIDFFSSASISTQADGSLLIQSSDGRIVLWVIACVILALTCFVLWRISALGRVAFTAGVLSLVIALLIIPAAATEKVVVSKDQLTVRTGFWFAPTRDVIDLDDLICIRERRADVHGEPKVFWLFEWHDGRTRELTLSDLLAANQRPVIEYLREHGIAVATAAEDEERAGSTFAAIAYSPKTGKYGYADNCRTRESAEQTARRDCKEEDARIVAWVHNGFCALAVGDGHTWGVGWSAGKEASNTAAKERALANCKKRSSTARLLICVSSSGHKPEMFD